MQVWKDKKETVWKQLYMEYTFLICKPNVWTLFIDTYKINAIEKFKTHTDGLNTFTHQNVFVE